MKKLIKLGVGAAAMLASTGAIAQSTVFTGLYNTGVADDGSLLAANDAAELHYGDKIRAGQPVTYSNSAYANVTDARFIAAFSGGGTGNRASVVYALSFDVGGSLDGATLSGLFAADNGGSIALNGVNILTLSGDPASNYNQLHAFSANSGFVVGQNILQFTITDTGNPSAFVVSGLTGTTLASAVPETATWAMMILGMGAIGFAMRRQKITTRVSYAA